MWVNCRVNGECSVEERCVVSIRDKSQVWSQCVEKERVGEGRLCISSLKYFRLCAEASLRGEVKEQAFVFMWTADTEDVCKTHLSTGDSSSVYIRGAQKENKFAATLLLHPSLIWFISGSYRPRSSASNVKTVKPTQTKCCTARRGARNRPNLRTSTVWGRYRGFSWRLSKRRRHAHRGAPSKEHLRLNSLSNVL